MRTIAFLHAPLLDVLERFAVTAVGFTTRALAGVDAGGDLTVAQWRALVVVDSEDGIRMGALAERLGMSRPSATRVIARLERRGAVALERDAGDGRAVVVRATATGSAFRAAVAARRRELVVDALAAYLPTAPAGLAGELDRLVEHLERDPDQADPEPAAIGAGSAS